jgi:hypothetical protein
MLVEALTAKYGTVATGLEGDLRGYAALVANHVVHLALPTAYSIVPASGAARGAAARLVLETLFGVERLFRSGEREGLAALLAG